MQILIFLSTLFTMNYTYPILPTTGHNIDSFIPKGYQIIYQKEGNLNDDKVKDVAVIIESKTEIANYGLNIEDINHIVSTSFAGGSAGVVYENERKFDLVVRLDSTHRNNIDDVSHLYIPTTNGTQIPLSQVAEIKMELGPAQISREDGKRRIVVGFNIKGRDVESVVTDIQKELSEKVKLPEGYYYTYGGTFENLQAASKRLMIALPVALALIFMLLYFTFSSVKQATLFYTAIPMSAIGGVFALLIRDMPFSISAGIGFIALFGVAVLNGIVLIGTFNQLEKDGMTDIIQRIKEGTKIRLRPVLMTATVASLGFLPMALSHGAGAEVQKPLATVVIGGLLTATFLTLFVLPLLYVLFSSKRKINISTASILVFALLSFNAANAQSPTTKSISVDDAITTALKNLEFQREYQNPKNDSDWFQIRTENKILNIYCGPESMKSTFEIFFDELIPKYSDYNFEYEIYLPLDGFEIEVWTPAKSKIVNERSVQITEIEMIKYEKIKVRDVERINFTQTEIEKSKLNFSVGDILEVEIVQVFDGIILTTKNKNEN